MERYTWENKGIWSLIQDKNLMKTGKSSEKELMIS